MPPGKALCNLALPGAGEGDFRLLPENVEEGNGLLTGKGREGKGSWDTENTPWLFRGGFLRRSKSQGKSKTVLSLTSSGLNSSVELGSLVYSISLLPGGAFGFYSASLASLFSMWD